MAEPNIKPGQPIDAWTAEAYREIVARIKDRQDLAVAAPLFMTQGTSAVLGISAAQGFYAKLSGSTSPYSFTEQYGAASGAWSNMVRTGTTNAYEVNGVASLNNKVAWVEPGYPGEYLFQYVGAGCTATVNAGPINCGGTLTGVTFDLRDAADTTTLATQTGSTASFTGLDGTLSYKVRVSKTGYHTRTSATVTPGCGGTSSASVSTWPTTISWTLHLRTNDTSFGFCPKSGVSVSATGDGSASGTTDASGNVTLSIGTNSTSSTQTYTVVSTAPAGSGCAVLTSSSMSVDACSPSNPNLTLVPASGYVNIVCNSRYMPDTLTWTDDYGTCSMAVSVLDEHWTGSYSYTSSHCIEDDLCAGLPDCFFDRTASVTVDVRFYRTGASSSCASSLFGIERNVPYGVASPPAFCNAGLLTKYQPLSDASAISAACGPPSLFSPISGFGPDETTVACSATLAFNFATGPYSGALTSGGPTVTFEETAVTVDVTGTIA